MLKRIAAGAAMLLAVACTRPPVRDEVNISFVANREAVYITANTTFEQRPANEQARARVEEARATALHADPWGIRFERVKPQSDELTMMREQGELTRLIRSARIEPEELQQVFSDLNVTVHVLRGNGWREISFYPGSSTRASREQQKHFNDELALWSAAVARYFTAIDAVYSYLDGNPQRAEYVFAALLSERSADGSDPVVLEEEQPLVDKVTEAMTEIGERMDAQEERATTFAEEADLLFNPLSARVTVTVPGDAVISSEGFVTRNKRDYVIEPVDLLEAVAALEGKWLSPDPLAALLRDERLTAKGLARQERRSSTFVSSAEVQREIRAKLERPKAYVVRWRE